MPQLLCDSILARRGCKHRSDDELAPDQLKCIAGTHVFVNCRHACTINQDTGELVHAMDEESRRKTKPRPILLPDTPTMVRMKHWKFVEDKS